MKKLLFSEETKPFWYRTAEYNSGLKVANIILQESIFIMGKIQSFSDMMNEEFQTSIMKISIHRVPIDM